MTNKAPEWALIEHLATQLGVKRDALRKWKERGRVPYRWQIPLVQASNGRITTEQFSDKEAA